MKKQRQDVITKERKYKPDNENIILNKINDLI